MYPAALFDLGANLVADEGDPGGALDGVEVARDRALADALSGGQGTSRATCQVAKEQALQTLFLGPRYRSCRQWRRAGLFRLPAAVPAGQYDV
jgi:hypothetical protein